MAQEMTELPAVASKFYHDCKKCETERYHTVLAHSTAKSAKIECEVCKKKSTFKLAVKKAKRKTTRKKKASEPNYMEMWEELNSKIGEGGSRGYTMADSFEKDTAINHPKFGIGYVVTSTPNKIEVIFKDSLKSLVHNRQ